MLSQYVKLVQIDRKRHQNGVIWRSRQCYYNWHWRRSWLHFIFATKFKVIWPVLTHFSAVLYFIYNPVIWFPLQIKWLVSKSLQFPADLVTFTEEILNGKLDFLYSKWSVTLGWNELNKPCYLKFVFFFPKKFDSHKFFLANFLPVGKQFRQLTQFSFNISTTK